MLPIVLLAFTLQGPGQLTEEDVPDILKAVTSHVRSQFTARAARLPSFIEGAAAESSLALNLPSVPQVPVFIDGAQAALAAREVVPSMPATVSDSGQSYTTQAREEVVRCSEECAIDNGGVFLTIEHISPGPGYQGSAERYWVSLLVESNDRRRPGTIRKSDRNLAIVRKDGVWRVSDGGLYLVYLVEHLSFE